MRMLRFLISSLLLLQLAACASITDRHQYMQVVTPKPDTKIYRNGVFLGEGTNTIRIVRKENTVLEFDTNGQREFVKLKSKYRWGHSFGGNALLIYFAPIGWAIDFWTGAAWESVPPQMEGPNLRTIGTHPKILILPPASPSSFQSLHYGEAVEEWVKRRYPQANIIPFEEGYRTSVVFGFDHEYSGEGEDIKDLSELLYATKATLLAFSRYDEKHKQIKIRVLNPYTGKVVSLDNIKNFTEPPAETSSQWVLRETFNLMPNTFLVGIVGTNYDTCATTNEVYRYCAEPEKSILNILSSLSLTNILHYRKRDPWRAYLRFYPDLTLSINNMNFRKYDPTLPNLDLDWHYLGIGYGARFSFVLPIGELYLQAHPFWAMNYLHAKSDRFDNESWVGKVGVTTQLGLNSWFTNRWNLAFYSKYQSQPLTAPGVEQIEPGIKFFDRLAIIQTGISVGYYFNEEKLRATKYLFD